ncbi:MAG TPA: tetratricopeptide repeat protein [Conexibacter sp.]
MTSEVVPLLKHTPSAQDPAVLEAITVQREPLISTLVEAVLDTTGGVRHHLLVGPRGIGKTHILSLVASRVRAAERDDIVLAWLDEDPWAIRTYDKFLAAIAMRVATAIEDADLDRDATVLRSRGGVSGEQLLRDAVGDRRLVLLAENLDEIFRRIGEDGQAKFRAFAEDWRRLQILATTPQLFAGVRQHASPFYGFFAITHLDELSLASAHELLARVARLHEDAGLLTFLQTEVAAHRLMAIEALAGGHPRVWLLLAGCVSVAAIDELVPLFLEALDNLTPYYQDRLRELSDQQQELVVLLSETGGALSNRELAERSGVAQNQVANILRELADRGYVRRAQLPEDLGEGDRRMSFWELREPLMRLCLDVKQARGEPLRIVVEFLRAWYGPRLLDEIARLPPTAELASAYASEAFRALEDSLDLEELLSGSPAEIVSRAERGLSLLPEHLGLKLAKAMGHALAGEYVQARELYAGLIETLPPGIARAAMRLQFVPVLRALDEPIDEGDALQDALAAETEAADDPEALVVLARTYKLAGHDTDAIAVWERVSELDPSSVEAHVQRGLLLDRLDRQQEALAAFEQASELDPQDAALHRHRGVALTLLGRYADALAALERAIELDADSRALHEHRGVLLELLARPQDALAAFDRALELESTNARVHDRRGVVLTTLRRLPEALAAFERAAELEPGNARYLDHCGAALGFLDRDEEALELFSRAVRLAPDEVTLKRNRAVVLNRLGRSTEALVTFTELSAAAPENALYHDDRGHALGELGRDVEALEAFTRAAELDSSDPRYLRNRGQVLDRLGRHEEALETFTRAVELDPSDHVSHTGRGIALHNLRRHEEELEAFERVCALNPTSARVHDNRAIALDRLERRAEALEARARAAELSPEEDEYQFNHGFALERAGRYEEALQAYTRAGELAPDNAGYLNSRANVLRLLGHVDEAERAIVRAIELEPDEPVFRFTHGEIVLTRGDVERGLALVRQALGRWSASRDTRPGETDLLCRIVWERFRGDPRRTALVAQLVSAYAGAGALEELGSGVVASIPLFVDDRVGHADAEAWVEDWSKAARSRMKIPLQLLDAALAWKRDRDKAHLLTLPPEQREILAELLSAEPE